MDTQQDKINGQIEYQYFLTLKCLTLTFFFPGVFLNVCSVVIDFRINTSLDLKRDILSRTASLKLLVSSGLNLAHYI